MNTGEHTTNDTAFERLYQDLGPGLLRYFCRRHGSQELAKDLLQETFASALRRAARCQESVSPAAYIFAIARNLSINTYRRSRPGSEMPAELAAPEPEPADPRLDQMRAAIRKLAPAQREVLELRLEQELSYEDIATVLQIPVGTVRSRLHHAVLQLRRFMPAGSRGRKVDDED